MALSNGYICGAITQHSPHAWEVPYDVLRIGPHSVLSCCLLLRRLLDCCRRISLAEKQVSRYLCEIHSNFCSKGIPNLPSASGHHGSCLSWRLDWFLVRCLDSTRNHLHYRSNCRHTSHHSVPWIGHAPGCLESFQEVAPSRQERSGDESPYPNVVIALSCRPKD